MNSKEIRKKFLDFFENKGHKIVTSAPMVNKNDPTLMFTNAGMNQFKDLFLGNQSIEYPRIADTQKCLRVSGKHNDLEDVGKDSYHHTMFEMLGNWSFGDYFKKEAIEWAWELLVTQYGIDERRLYATIFEGDQQDGIEKDTEALDYWKQFLPEERILDGNKKDNFWEMGDTGPCGPCSEIHIDLRTAEERAKVDGATLVNQDHPLVIEVWNLVFIEFERMENGNLKSLPAKHVDTGMGFERLCMVLQGKTSNYDTDIFQPFIQFIENATEVKYHAKYGVEHKSDMAFRVMVDHLRAVAFAIADGAIPSNTGAGYVIRRILRRAVRYYYSFLNYQKPLLHKMLPLLAQHFGDTFPEIKEQNDFIKKVIFEEENNFLGTLSDGLKRIDNLNLNSGDMLPGTVAFELYDTYGFPLDLTTLVIEEKGATVDVEGFERCLQAQKDRGRKDAERRVGDWKELIPGVQSTFVGYDELHVTGAKVLKYRKIEQKKNTFFQLVLDRTPFYAEGGGQVGDQGVLIFGDEEVKVVDTVRENDLFIHLVKKLPDQISKEVEAKVFEKVRKNTENNHSATHLLHAALRQVLGSHVQQKGSLVASNHLRFDFSHFQKMTEPEIQQVENLVNQKIRENINRIENRSIPLEAAKEKGAMMLFGEKYGEEVRMITFDPSYSVELCGGCHVQNTGQIGYFKILHESSVAAGIRRVEAVTGEAAHAYIQEQFDLIKEIRSMLKNPKSLEKSLHNLLDENRELKKQLEDFKNQQANALKKKLLDSAEKRDNATLIISKIELSDAKQLKTLIHQLVGSLDQGLVALGANVNGKPQLAIGFDKEWAEKTDIHAGKLVKDAAKAIRGGGGGQAFFATAGGSDLEGLDDALEQIRMKLMEYL